MEILDQANKKTRTMTKKNTCSHTLWAIHNNPRIDPYDWKRKNEEEKKRFQQNLLRESLAAYDCVLVWHLDCGASI